MTLHGPRVALSVAAAALLAMTACSASGDTSTAPTDADPDEFCEVWEDFAGMEPSVGDDINGWDTDFTNWPKKLRKVGTPSDMTEQQRRGWEVYVETFDEWQGESGFDREDDLSSSDNDAWNAFYSGYVYDHCEPYGEHE